MKKIKKKNIYILISIFIILTTTLTSYFYYRSTYVAKLAGERITKSEFSFFLRAVKNEMEEQANIGNDPKKIEDFWKSKIAGENAVDVAIDEALKRLIELKIELIKADENDVALNKAEKKELEKAIYDKVVEAGGDKKANIDFLKNYGVNVKEYTDIYREFRIIYNFMSLMQKKIIVSDQEALNFYEQDKDKIDVVTVRQILFSTMDSFKGSPLADDKRIGIKLKAEETLGKIRKGEDMTKLVDTLSEESEAKENHGIYIVEYVGQNSNYQKEFKEWSISHYPGDLGLIQTVRGYHIIRVEKRTVFEEVKSKAIESAKASKLQNLVEEWKKEPQYILDKNDIVLNTFK